MNATVDITGAILRRWPDAVVERRQHDAGIAYEVRVPRHRTVRLSVEWGDDQEAALAALLADIEEAGR